MDITLDGTILTIGWTLVSLMWFTVIGGTISALRHHLP